MVSLIDVATVAISALGIVISAMPLFASVRRGRRLRSRVKVYLELLILARQAEMGDLIRDLENEAADAMNLLYWYHRHRGDALMTRSWRIKTCASIAVATLGSAGVAAAMVGPLPAVYGFLGGTLLLLSSGYTLLQLPPSKKPAWMGGERRYGGTSPR